ncbi:MAG: pentapeptide repeat-containing protein [Bacteroidales bacterium]|nr:pentapeptide repeat-containing protein [Bacteroidales bacterium]
MSKLLITDQTFSAIDFSEKTVEIGEYEGCTFINCSFASTDLSNIEFAECEFRNCDLSLAKLGDTSFREIKFDGCKMLGLHFDDCRQFLFSASFEGCQINLSSFYKVNLKEKSFTHCQLQEVDFTETNLMNASFVECELAGATFDRTNLEKADFRTAYNYTIDPENNRIKRAKFSQAGVIGLLSKYNIVIE